MKRIGVLVALITVLWGVSAKAEIVIFTKPFVIHGHVWHNRTKKRAHQRVRYREWHRLFAGDQRRACEVVGPRLDGIFVTICNGRAVHFSEFQ